MATTSVAEYLDLVPALVRTPHRAFWSTYDAEADVLYLNFKKPSVALGVFVSGHISPCSISV
jgi:hypothetical protein